MIKGIVTRNDKIWQGHPDVTIFNKRLFVVFRESDRHATYGNTRIKLTSCSLKSTKFKFDNPITIAETSERFNCPRLSVINKQLHIVCDEIDASQTYGETENQEKKTRNFLFSSKNGEDWDEPFLTNITGIVPDRIVPTRDGKFLIATHTKTSSFPSMKDETLNDIKISIAGQLAPYVWVTNDLQGQWERHLICHNSRYNLCEASIVYVHDKYLCLMRENSAKGLPAFACTSNDGINWGSIYQTRMFGCHRPVCGVLKSGNLLTTYREASNSFKPGFWGKNTFACLTKPRSIFNDFTDSILLPLDHDNSSHSDSGYTGWVQLKDNSIFIVNYITKDAPKPYIQWYLLNESEF